MVKNIYCTIKYTCCSLMMSMAVTVGVAQEKIADRLNTPAALENMKMRGLWSQSKNAAGALLDIHSVMPAQTWNIGFMTEIFVVLSREKVGIMWFSTPKEEER